MCKAPMAASLLLLSLASGGCGREEVAETAPPGATQARAPIQASAAHATNSECAEDDIECTEAIYQLEETLFAYEATVAQQVAPGARACWQQEVDAFRQALDACDNVGCRLDQLRNRIASLHYQQPDERRAQIELPTVPRLLAVLAPAEQTHGTPAREGSHNLFEVSGPLVQTAKHTEHMGIAVNAGDKDHVFIFEMEIGSGSDQDEVLGLVGTSPTTHVLVRGYLEDAPTGVPNFDQAQCRWVYEVVR